jgi:hypothetical protein
MRLHNILLLSLLSLFVIAACNMFNEPKHNNPNRNVTLNVEDASCTEAWIEVKFTGVEFPTELRFYVNDSLAESITAVKDTLLYIEGLQPSRTYRVRAKAVRPQETLVKSTEAEVTTMDTTSHNFTWQTYTFGGSGGSSYLRDVAIINENDIWAVGEINIADTANPNGYTTYNAVHWNGQEWELKRIMFYIDQDQPWAGKTPYPCNSAFVFQGNTLGVTSGGQVYILNNDGSDKLLPMGFSWENRFMINAMWGTSSNDFYVVGDNGNIAHYNGTSWEKIESGTESNIHDIWGIKTDKGLIFACAATNYLASGDRKILLYENNKSVPIYWPSGLEVSSVWFPNLLHMFSCGEGIYKRIGTNWERQLGFENTTFTEKIRGQSIEDIFVVGDFGFVAHYNGADWEIYDELDFDILYSVSYKNNTVVSVGSDGWKAVIVVGRR